VAGFEPATSGTQSTTETPNRHDLGSFAQLGSGKMTPNDDTGRHSGKSRGLKSDGYLLDRELAEILLQTALRGMANKLLLGMRAPNQPN